MTATQTETPAQTKHVLWFKPAAALIRALSNGLLFAGADKTLPALACIKFEFDGAALEALSTDRYRVCIEPVELDRGMDQSDQPSFEFLLPRDAAKAALAFLKGNRRDQIQLSYDAIAGAVRLSAYGSSVEYRTLNSAFPAVRQLFPTSDTVAVDRIGFTRAFLADLGKVATAEKLEDIAVQTYGKHKPVLVEFAHDGPRVLLTSLRLKD